MIDGNVDEGFGGVADAFRRNFSDRNEVGAACSVFRDGRAVVDLWGGHRDAERTQPWERDTLVPVFSTTKGMASLAMAVAHSRGLFDLDERVASYWPEFAQNDKFEITVRQLLSHQAGLAVIDEQIDLATLRDPDRLGSVLAAQAPKWHPGEFHGYHGQSLGWYESQLLRRVDPDQRTIGRYFADEVARALDIEFYIGLPDEVGDDRIATFSGGSPASAIFHLHEMPVRLVLGLFNPWSLTGQVFRNPKILAKASDINRREILQIELPSVNGTGQARAIAKAYGTFATGGHQLGIDARTIAALEAPASVPVGGNADRVLRVDTAYSFGFMKPFPMLPFGSSTRAYGHTGTGGSFGFADPDRGLGYAYVMNRLGFPSRRIRASSRCATRCTHPSESRCVGRVAYMKADEIAVAHTPEGGYGDAMPAPILAGCTEPLAAGAPDMRGMWRVTSVAWATGVAPDPDPIASHVERIEQCGDRVCITSTGIIHDIRADGTIEHGVNDVAAANGQAISVVCTFEDGVHVLRPVGMPGIEVTRRFDGDTLVWTYGPMFTARMERIV